MGKGHKDRRREKRARESEELSKDEHLLKEELQQENEKKNEEYQLLRKQNKEQAINEKSIETLSDTTDSGRGSSITTSTDSLQQTKSDQQDESIENRIRRSLIKGLYNIGNTCFFNVIIQSLAHTSLLIDSMYQTIECLIRKNEKNYASTVTVQLMDVFDQFTSNDRKKPSIDPKPLFNCIIQKIPAYKGYDQHDSHELFMNLMLILRAEEIQLKQLEPRRRINFENDDNVSKMFCLIGCNEPYTTYDSIFGGHLLDIITCQKCGKSLMKIEPFLGLLLPLTDRISPSENYRNRRRRDAYTGNKPKRETKILSRKQEKALKKQEKKNSRKGTRVASGKIKGRQSLQTKIVQEQLPLEQTSSVPSTEATTITNGENETKESVDTKTENSIQEDKEPEAVNQNNDEGQAAGEEEEKQLNGDDSNEDDDNDNNKEEEEDEEEESKGPLTSVESTCVLADMVSKLTLIHETASYPLPFVDRTIAQKFLDCRTSKNSITPNETDGIKKLEQCFQRYFKSETLSGDNSFDCYYCRSFDKTQKKVLTEAIRQTVFFQLPPILPIFLKRFQMFNSHSEKINKSIEFPLQLDLTNHCSSQVISTSSIYSLYAIIEHSGTLRSGHYIAYIKLSVDDNDLLNKFYSKPIDCLLTNLFQNTIDQQPYMNGHATEIGNPSAAPPAWYHISDNDIHKVPESKVLEADAYVLFYRRINNES
ncbi:unnamed protein product [Rotaria magnacalcarata]|uniref:Ubiquitin carboxyl-terminal hydrolase n=2 Tax=Rotaria magnacalcarata TaxID=392030 RepID=A0A815AAN5_9BILA|nr:unnamed protein product [Rotaria magnacalcarata]